MIHSFSFTSHLPFLFLVVIILSAKSSFWFSVPFFLQSCLLIYFEQVKYIFLFLEKVHYSFEMFMSFIVCFFQIPSVAIGNFCSPLMLSVFLLSQVILNCPSVRCQTIFKSIVWVGFGWERLEGILCIIRLHFVLASKQISLFTVDHQMMIYGILSLVRLSRKNYWHWLLIFWEKNRRNIELLIFILVRYPTDHWSSSLFFRVSGFAFLQRSSSSPLSSLCEFLITKFP